MKTRDLYERCWLCNGTLAMTAPAMVDGLKRDPGPQPGVKAGPYSGPLAVGSLCPCVGSSSPGWSPVGVTAGQLERLVTDRDRLKASNAAALAACKAVVAAQDTGDVSDVVAAMDICRAALATAEQLATKKEERP